MEKLPFFFGEYSELCPKDLHLLNQMDDTIQGMHLCIDILQESKPIKSQADITNFSSLAIINYSCSGWSLRLQLLKERKWVIYDSLVFEIDEPCDSSSHCSEEEFSQHYVYELELIQGSN